MLAPIHFDIDRLRGREALHFVNHKGNFAFSEDLRPKPTGGNLTIFCQYLRDSDLFAGGFLKVLTGRDITFLYGSPSDPRFCEADFVFTRSKVDYLLGSNNNPWEVLLSVAWNTPWVAELFAEPEGRDEFLQDIWYACYSGVTDIRLVGTYSNWSETNIATKSLMFLAQALGNKLKKAKFVSIIMHKLRDLVPAADGLVVAPANAQGWGIRYVRQYIVSLQAPNPVAVIIMKERDRWLIYPGQTLDAEGNPQDIMDFRTLLGTEHKETLRKLGSYSKMFDATMLISCPDKQAAVLIGGFFRDAFFGRIQNKTLQDIVEAVDASK